MNAIGYVTIGALDVGKSAAFYGAYLRDPAGNKIFILCSL
jgi:hypothetical protein